MFGITIHCIAAGLFLGMSYHLFKERKLKSAPAQKKYLLALGLFAGFYLAEILLRLLNIGTTYSEQREGVFVNPAERAEKSWYLTWQPYAQITLASGSDYSFPRTANSEGLSDKEWMVEKDSNEIRVMTLGDSFTEGDGCAYDSTYPRVLERMLQKEFPQVKINVFNAGRCGSDPWFEYKKLHDRLLKYQPDIVMYTNGSNDLFFDHLCYGGMERFAPDSTVKNRIPRHRWLILYEVSYVFRVVVGFLGYDNTLFGYGDREKDKSVALADAREMSRKYSELAVQNNFTCIQLIRPDKNEIEDGAYVFNPEELTNGTDTLPRYFTFDLLRYYQDSLHISQSNVDEYYWRIDQHHNARGYAAMARAVFSCLKPVVREKIKQEY